MKSLTLFFSKIRDTNRDGGPPVGETSGGGESPAVGGTTPSREGEEVAEIADGERDALVSPTTSGEEEGKMALMENPPTDDVCPICFENFEVPCRGPCGHWYCGSCILQYWNFSAALQPCRCPMCSQRITKLIPEASLNHSGDVEITRVLRKVGDYNRLYVGGISGFMLKFLAIPLFIKRMFRELLNPDRPGLYLHEMRLIALLLGILYSFIPVDFLRIGRRNIIDVFDYSAFALSLILYVVGLYLRRRRRRNVRELVDDQAEQE